MPTYIPSQLFGAIRDQDAATVRTIAKANPVLLQVRNERGSTPLILAAYLGDLGSTQAIVEAGADLEATDRSGTALMGASFKGHAEIVGYLLAQGASHQATNEAGATALDYARMGNHQAVIDLLESA